MKQITECLKCIFVFFMVCIWLSGCSSGSTAGNPDPVDPTTNPSPETEFKTIRIGDHLQECHGFIVRPCMLGGKLPEDDGNYYFDDIEGFEFQWGYNYELEISISPIENPLADGSSLRYTLLNMVSKTPVEEGTTFNYYSRYRDNTITKKSDNIYSLFNFDVKDFICEPSDCEMLDSLLSLNMAILFEFQHAEELSDPLILRKIVCNASFESFPEKCLNTQPTEPNEHISIGFNLQDKFDQVASNFAQGEPIKFVFDLENTSNDDVNLNFNSGQQFDIYIRAVDNADVWRWSDGRVFTQALGNLLVGAMNTVQQKAIWDQSLSDGSLLEVGEYRAYGQILNQIGPIEYVFFVQ